MILFFNILDVIVSFINLIFAIFMLLILVKQREALEVFFETIFQKNAAKSVKKQNNGEQSGLTDL